VVKATVDGLQQLRTREDIARVRELDAQEPTQSLEEAQSVSDRLSGITTGAQ
jgi:hypothetical protein